MIVKGRIHTFKVSIIIGILFLLFCSLALISSPVYFNLFMSINLIPFVLLLFFTVEYVVIEINEKSIIINQGSLFKESLKRTEIPLNEVKNFDITQKFGNQVLIEINDNSYSLQLTQDEISYLKDNFLV